MHKYSLLAKTLFGLEDFLSAELTNLGAENVVKRNRAVSFEGDKSLLYKSNLSLRTALSILKPIEKFYAHDPQRLYRRAKRIEWDEYFTSSETIMIDCTSFGRNFKHSHYAALKLKDAIADYFTDKTGKRPSVDKENPDIRINLHIVDKQCTVSLDSSGISLDKRSYKTEHLEAPMGEVLAAGLIMNSKLEDYDVFHDPMCGSGTIAIEAAMMAMNKAPGLLREFSFRNWKDFDEGLYMDVRAEVQSAEIKPKMKILASDIDMNAIEICRRNAVRAGVEHVMEIKNMDFFQSHPKAENGIMFTNPPYGERLNKDENITKRYGEIADYLKNNYQNWDAFIFSGNLDALKHFGLKPSLKKRYLNGAIECKLNKYELYQGSKK